MNNIKCTNLRLNLDKPLDRQAWEYLQGMDKEQFRSYSSAVVLAVNDYFQRLYRDQNDPYFETREREERFVSEIVSAVEQAVEKELPGFLTACFSRIVQPYCGMPEAITPVKQTAEDMAEKSLEDIDLDFTGC